MTLDNFLDQLSSSTPLDLAVASIDSCTVHAIQNPENYQSFLAMIRRDYQHSTHIAIMGSGNWKYSLNPRKQFSEYSIESDIDVAIVCEQSFKQTWDELRSYHRLNYYAIPKHAKEQLKRNGENVYSGFVSPKWIPSPKSIQRFAYLINTNNYSVEAIGYRTVNMMYFKNRDEAIDYYVRGFFLAKQRTKYEL